MHDGAAANNMKGGSGTAGTGVGEGGGVTRLMGKEEGEVLQAVSGH